MSQKSEIEAVNAALVNSHINVRKIARTSEYEATWLYDGSRSPTARVFASSFDGALEGIKWHLPERVQAALKPVDKADNRFKVECYYEQNGNTWEPSGNFVPGDEGADRADLASFDTLQHAVNGILKRASLAKRYRVVRNGAVLLEMTLDDNYDEFREQL